MTDFIEGNLLFRFDERWSCLSHWDRHDAYYRGIRRCESGKAVDFIGVLDRKVPYLIEVKDFRIHERSAAKLSLPCEFERKIRDTIAALAGTHCHGKPPDCADVFQTLIKTRKPHLVLWRETADIFSRTHLSENSILLAEVKRQLQWINSVPYVTSRMIRDGDLPGLKVSDLGPERLAHLNELLQAIEDGICRGQFRRDEKAIWKIKDTLEIVTLDRIFSRVSTARSIRQMLA